MISIKEPSIKCLTHIMPSVLCCINQSFLFFFGQVSNRELLHAVVALYDVSLSEMMPDVLYASITEKWGRTVLLLRDIKGLYRTIDSIRSIHMYMYTYIKVFI